MPPPTATSRSPTRIAWSRTPHDLRPEAHTLLTVSDGTSFGIPPLIWAWRDGIWPWPACRTCPYATPWTWSGATSARSSAAAIVLPPRSVASRLESPPPSLPNGVRAAPRITVLGMVPACLLVGGSTTIPCATMSPIDVRARRGAPEQTDADTRVIPLFEDESLDDHALQ